MLINIIVLILSAFFAQFVQGQQKMSLFETISRIEEKYPDLRNMNLESECRNPMHFGRNWFFMK